MSNLVEKEGRLPYDADKRRLARSPYEQRDQTSDYVSWQSKINSEPNGTINNEILEEYINDHEYLEIKPRSLKKIGMGARIAYITKENKWRSGGFLISIEESNEDADGNELDKPKTYALYKSFNNAVFSVQVEDVKMFYTKMRKKDIEIKKRIYFKRPGKKTNFPVFLVNRDNEEVVIAYGRDSHERKIITSRNKYQLAAEDPELWEFDDGTWN